MENDVIVIDTDAIAALVRWIVIILSSFAVGNAIGYLLIYAKLPNLNPITAWRNRQHRKRIEAMVSAWCESEEGQTALANMSRVMAQMGVSIDDVTFPQPEDNQ